MLLRPMLPPFVLVMAAVSASAQTVSEPVQSIGVGAQWALPYRPHDGPGVQLSWRRWVGPHLGVGTDFRWFQRTKTTDVGSPGHGVRGQDVVRTSSSGFGVGVLGRQSAGRLSIAAGFGPGFFVDGSRHERQVNAQRDAGRHAERSVGIQATLELEVRATSRLSAFAGLRMELRDVRQSESRSGYPAAGIRFAF